MVSKPAERHLASDDEILRFIDSIGLLAPKRVAASSEREALDAADSIGRPVALKLQAPGLLHKSDVGGVALSLHGDAEIGEAFQRMTEIGESLSTSTPATVVVEAMAPPGVELVLSVTTDDMFGRSVMLGVGGVLIEMIDDVAMRLLPLTLRDAQDMVSELRSQELFKGFRGGPAVDVEALCQLVVRLSTAVDQDPSIYEVEFNPVIASGSTFTAVDWNMTKLES